jgi:hypothetical protein
MTIQYVNIGQNPNDGTGDDLRTAFLKVNDNFDFLAGIGGETNLGANLGGATGQVFAGKTNETLNFRTLAAGTGISINQSGNVITIGNTFTAPSSFNKVFVGETNSIYYTASGPEDSFRIKGDGAISVSLLGNQITLTGVFNLSDDLSPLLSGSLDLNGKNIVGTGNINTVGSATVDSLQVGRSSGPGDWPGLATINGNLVVNGTTTLASGTAVTLGVSQTLTATNIVVTTGTITGNLTGATTGTHYGNVSVKIPGVDGDGLPFPDAVIVNTAGVSGGGSATITGNLFGNVSGGFTGDIITGGVDLNEQTISGKGRIIVNGDAILPQHPLVVNSVNYAFPIGNTITPTINDSGFGALFTMSQQNLGISEAIKVRSLSKNSTQIVPVGSGIGFESVNVEDNQDGTYDLTLPITVTFQSKTLVGGKYYVTFTVPFAESAPSLQTRWTVSGNSNSNYNGVYYATASTPVSITIKYGTSDPGVFGTGTTTITPEKQPNYLLHGWIGMQTYNEQEFIEDSPTNYSTFVARVRANKKGIFIPPSPDDVSDAFFDAIVARGNGVITIGKLNFEDAIIQPSIVATNLSPIPEDPSRHDVLPYDYDLIIKNNAVGKYINFYGSYDPTLIVGIDNAEGKAIGGYSFPKEIGTPGQVLSVRIPDGINPNNLLEWTTPSGGGGGGGGSTTFLGLVDTPNSYTPGSVPAGGKLLRVKADLSGIEFVDSFSGTLTGTLIGNAATASKFLNTVEINGIAFDGSSDIDLTTADVQEDPSAQYFTEERVRDALSVVANSSLTFDPLTGEFDLAESVTTSPDTLVKRDNDGSVSLSTAKISSIEKNTGDVAITLNSPVSTSSSITSSSSITTTGSLSAGFITLTGTGDQTLTSTAKLILNPTTSVDLSGKKIVNLSLTAPTDDGDATSKKYVDEQNSSTFTASLQNVPISGDTGGVLTVSKGTTVNINGSTNISTTTTGSGIQVNLKTTVSGFTVSGNLPVTGQLTANTVRGGNVLLTGNSVTQTVTGNDLNLVPGLSGGAVVVSGGDLELSNSRLVITGSDISEFPANTLEIQISITTNVTFIRTLNWVDTNANLAYAELPNGIQGQVKTIIMKDRGTYGDALDTRPRYLVLRGNINGSSRTVNIAANDPNGSSTFIFLDNYWWRTSNVA